MCVPLYNNVKPILKFISIQEVFISIFNSDSVVKNNQNQKAGQVSQHFLKTVNLGALSIWEPSTRKRKTSSGNNHLKSLTLKFLQNLAIHAGLLFKNELNFLYKISEVKLWLQSLQINNLTSLMKARSVDDDLHTL